MKKYKDKAWLEQKYLIERLSTYKIARLCEDPTTSTTVWRWLRKYGIHRNSTKSGPEEEDLLRPLELL